MKRLVLVGLGHAHLYVLEALARAPVPGVETVLVSLGTRQLYSGMVPGWIAGDYTLEQLSFDLAGRARCGSQAGAERRGRAEGDRHELQLGDGRVLGYDDMASFDIGSPPAGIELPGVKEHALVLKPMERTLTVLTEAAWQSGPLLVVGGGAAGVELALCLQPRTGRPTTLLERGEAVPRGASRAARRLVRELLARRGVELRTAAVLASLSPEAAQMESGESLPFTTCVWAAGAGRQSSSREAERRWMRKATSRWRTRCAAPRTQSCSQRATARASSAASTSRKQECTPCARGPCSAPTCARSLRTRALCVPTAHSEAFCPC